MRYRAGGVSLVPFDEDGVAPGDVASAANALEAPTPARQALCPRRRARGREGSSHPVAARAITTGVETSPSKESARLWASARRDSVIDSRSRSDSVPTSSIARARRAAARAAPTAGSLRRQYCSASAASAATGVHGDAESMRRRTVPLSGCGGSRSTSACRSRSDPSLNTWWIRSAVSSMAAPSPSESSAWRFGVAKLHVRTPVCCLAILGPPCCPLRGLFMRWEKWAPRKRAMGMPVNGEAAREGCALRASCS
jgi:hypothetical protein